MMGCGTWQAWQGGGNMLAKLLAKKRRCWVTAGSAVRGLLAAIAVARDVLVIHTLPGRCAVYVARLRDLPLCLLC